jgi:hypothetical protein
MRHHIVSILALLGVAISLTSAQRNFYSQEEDVDYRRDDIPSRFRNFYDYRRQEDSREDYQNRDEDEDFPLADFDFDYERRSSDDDGREGEDVGSEGDVGSFDEDETQGNDSLEEEQSRANNDTMSIRDDSVSLSGKDSKSEDGDIAPMSLSKILQLNASDDKEEVSSDQPAPAQKKKKNRSGSNRKNTEERQKAVEQR